MLTLYGAGGHGREVLGYLRDIPLADEPVRFMVDDAYYSSAEIMGVPVIRRSDFDGGPVVLTVGDCRHRARLAAMGAPYASVIHPSAYVASLPGDGAMVAPGVVVTCNVRIGRHVILNPHASVAHDCVVGDCVTIAGGARLSGGVTVGSRVWVGTNAAIREGVSVCDDVTIGMGAMVVRDITEPGTYAGVPARRIS